MGITLLSGPIGLKFRCAMCYFGLGPMPVAAVVPAYFLLTPHRSRPLALRRQAWQAVAVAILVLLVAAPTLAIAHFTGSEVQFLFNAFWAGAFLINIGCAATAWFRPAFKLPLLGNWVMGILEWTDRPVPSGTMPLSFSMRYSFAVSLALYIAGGGLLCLLILDEVKGLLPLMIIYAGVSLIVLGRRFGTAGALQRLARSPQAPVLYLRSFAVDDRDEGQKTRWTLGELASTRDEQMLARMFRAIGPVIAIGRPGERLPQLGAARVYFRDGEWQTGVAELMRRSAVVLLRVGATDGFLWEIKQAIDLVPPTKLVFYFSHRWHGKQLESEYASFVRGTLGLFPKPLPETIEREHLLLFDAQWSPFLAGPLDKSYAAEFLPWLLAPPIADFFVQALVRRRLTRGIKAWSANRRAGESGATATA